MYLNELQKKVFSINCTTSSCHSADRAAGNLVLAEGLSYTQVVDVSPDNLAAKSAGLVRVKKGSTDLSFLWRKLTNQLTSDEGTLMPQAGVVLDPAQLDLAKRWIEGGALCQPLDCATLKKNCGTPDNGCGTPLSSCGTCSGADTCGGGGVDFVCGQ